MKKLIAILCVVVLAASVVVGVTTVRSSNRIKDLNNDLSAMQEAMNTSLQNIETLNADVAAKAAEIETLNADVTAKTEEIEALTADVAAKAAEIEALTAEAAAKAEEIRALTEQAGASQEQIALLTAQAAEAEERIAVLTAETEEKASTIEVLSGQLDVAQNTLQIIADAINGKTPEAEQPDAGSALPKVGDVISGFEVREIRDFPAVGGSLLCLEHQKTGAKVFYIANEDTNRAFSIHFKTHAIDNTGLPHVFEHAVTAGSERYPSNSLFLSLMSGAYVTFMNAQTTDAMTLYPCSSLSEAQLLKLADYYLDCCFHPLILQNETIFRTEAWRYRMAGMEDELTIEGTVYSEVLGGYSIERAAMINANKLAFPGAAIGYDFGGHPDYISDMTWETLKEYHGRYYHPSNSFSFLYGKLEDYGAFLTLLDGVFASYDRQEFGGDEPNYATITEPVVAAVPYPVPEGTSTEKRSIAYYYIVCPGMKDDPAEEARMEWLASLLTNSSSPLMQALKKALPGAYFSAGVEVAAPDRGFVFTAQNINPEDAELFRTTVDDCLRSLAETGFTQEFMDAVVASCRRNQRMVSEVDNLGYNLSATMGYTYATSGDIFGYLDSYDQIELLDTWNKEGLFQQGITKWLLDKQTTALVTTYPAPGEREVHDAALAEKLAEIKAGMTEEEKQAIIDATNAPVQKDDPSALAAELTAVTVQSLPEETRIYPVSDETDEAGIRRVNVTAAVDGFGRSATYVDISGLPQEDIQWAKLYTDLIELMDTSAHTEDELTTLTSRYMQECNIYTTAMSKADGFTPTLFLGFTCLDEDLATCYDLMYELVFDTQFDDLAKLQEKIQLIKNSTRNYISNNADYIAISRAKAAFSEGWKYDSYISDVDYYQFLEQVEAQAAENPEAVAARLAGMREKLNNRTNIVLAYSGSEAGIEANRPLADAFAARMNSAPIEPVKYDLPVPAAREAVIVDSNVQQNVLTIDFAQLGLDPADPRLSAIGLLVEDVFLIPLLRDTYGVYTPLCNISNDHNQSFLYILAYSDPNIAETYNVLQSLPDQLDARQFDQETLDRYILTVYSGLAQNPGELAGAREAMANVVAGCPQNDKLERMRLLKTMTPEDVTAATEYFRKLAENGRWGTVGSASEINANAEMFDSIINLFGVADNTKVTLTDVPEGSAHYEAVRFAFENGLLPAKGEDVFGVDDKATVGELAYALCGIGGAPVSSPEEAVAFLAEYQIVPADITADAELTLGLNDTIFVNFGAAVGLTLTPDVPEEHQADPLSRGELAEQLKKFVGLLQ